MFTSILLPLCLLFLKANSQLSIRVGYGYDWVWDSSGSKSNLNGSFWKPRLNEGEAFVSFANTIGYTEPEEFYVIITSWPTNALADPDRYEWIWDNSGSDDAHNVWFYKPIPPDRYICFGDFVSRSSSVTSSDGYKCIHESYVHELTSTQVTQSLVWSDEGSDADNDVQVIKIAINALNNHHAEPPHNYYRMIQYHRHTIPGPYYSFTIVQLISNPRCSLSDRDPDPFNWDGWYRCECYNGQLLVVSNDCGYNMDDCSGQTFCEWQYPNGESSCLRCI